MKGWVVGKVAAATSEFPSAAMVGLLDHLMLLHCAFFAFSSVIIFAVCCAVSVLSVFSVCSS